MRGRGGSRGPTWAELKASEVGRMGWGVDGDAGDPGDGALDGGLSVERG